MVYLMQVNIEYAIVQCVLVVVPERRRNRELVQSSKFGLRESKEKDDEEKRIFFFLLLK